MICIQAIMIACRAVVALKTLGQESEFEHALGARVRCLLGIDMVGRAFWGGGQSEQEVAGAKFGLSEFRLDASMPSRSSPF